MAYDVASAIDYVLHFEDAQLTGKVTIDKGGKTRFGVSQRANPDLTDKNFYALPVKDALVKARSIYETRYANVVRSAATTDDCVRAKILDMYVNMGIRANKIVQQAVGTTQDGAFGLNTLTLVNDANAGALLQRVARMSVAYYDTLNGTEAEHESWRTRASCLGKIGVNLR